MRKVHIRFKARCNNESRRVRYTLSAEDGKQMSFPPEDELNSIFQVGLNAYRLKKDRALIEGELKVIECTDKACDIEIPAGPPAWFMNRYMAPAIQNWMSTYASIRTY